MAGWTDGAEPTVGSVTVTGMLQGTESEPDSGYLRRRRRRRGPTATRPVHAFRFAPDRPIPSGGQSLRQGVLRAANRRRVPGMDRRLRPMGQRSEEHDGARRHQVGRSPSRPGRRGRPGPTAADPPGGPGRPRGGVAPALEAVAPAPSAGATTPACTRSASPSPGSRPCPTPAAPSPRARRTWPPWTAAARRWWSATVPAASGPSISPTARGRRLAGPRRAPDRLDAVGQPRRRGHRLRLRGGRQRRRARPPVATSASPTPGRSDLVADRPPTPTATTACRRRWPSGPSKGVQAVVAPSLGQDEYALNAGNGAMLPGLAVLHRRQRLHHAVAGRPLRQRADRGRRGR